MAKNTPPPAKDYEAEAEALVQSIRESYIASLELPYRDYWLRLGEFVTQFAVIERRLQGGLRHFAGVSNKIGQAAFGGVRVKEAIDAINRLLEVRNLKRVKARLREPFAHLGIINKARNDILHYGSHRLEDEDTFLVTNRYLVHSDDKVREIKITHEHLRAMTADLVKINHHLSLEIEKAKMKRSVYRHPFRMMLKRPWQYKPLQPAPPGKRTPLTHRGMPRRRRASGE